MRGGVQKVYDIHGNYTLYSVTDPTVVRGSGNLLKDTVYRSYHDQYHNNAVEFVERLTVIDRHGQTLFELTNKTLGVRPAQWTWRDLQGGQ